MTEPSKPPLHPADAPNPAHLLLVDQMVTCHAAHDYQGAFQAATELGLHYSLDDGPNLDERIGGGLVFSYVFVTAAQANQCALQRQFIDAAQRCEHALSVLKTVAWKDNLDHDPIFREFRKLELQLSVQMPLMRANEALLRGSLREASLHVLSAESRLPEIRSILSQDDKGDDAYMRITALTVMNGYFAVAAAVHMQNATAGDRLMQAQMFFETIDIILAEVGELHVLTQQNERENAVMMAMTKACRQRVEGEVKAAEQDYATAISKLTEAILAFERIVPLISDDDIGSDTMRDQLVNMGPLITQSIRHYSTLQLMQDKLAMAERDHADLAQDLRTLDERKDQIIRDFVRKNVSVNVQNVNDFAASVQIQNEANLMMQNNGMDQVLAILAQLPPSAETEAVKKDAQKAKEEKDLSKKIEKVAAVIDGASKVVAAGAKLVPYGPPVLAALKGVFGMLTAMKRTDDDDEDTLPRTFGA